MVGSSCSLSVIVDNNHNYFFIVIAITFKLFPIQVDVNVGGGLSAVFPVRIITVGAQRFARSKGQILV